jgi:hypothetical protein
MILFQSFEDGSANYNFQMSNAAPHHAETRV